VTVALVGCFLIILPIPGAKPWGEKLLMMGVGVCGSCICDKAQEDQDNEKDKK